MKKISIVWLILIQGVLALEWLHSSFGKWTDSKFMDGIAKTLEGFAAKSTFPGYPEFLNNVAIPNAQLFGQMIRTGEVAVGIALAISGLIIISKKPLPSVTLWLTVIAFLGGALMNINFFLASGASSPSSWGLNLLMTLVQIIFAVFYIQNRQLLAQKD
jgi:thiosulfate dehydrogenase (quinone) large subunit